eukprot:7431960-Alexandrium_andersonii.AAC.1
MSGMSSSRETAVSGVPSVTAESSISPGTASASARRWGLDSQLAIRPRIPAVALLAASAAARLGPGPGLGSTSPSSVRSRVHSLGLLRLARSLSAGDGPGSGSTSPSCVRSRIHPWRSCWQTPAS